jgi:hypothetical protein
MFGIVLGEETWIAQVGRKKRSICRSNDQTLERCCELFWIDIEGA